MVLRAALDADRANVVFPDEWERLTGDEAIGELRLIDHGEAVRTRLRQPLTEFWPRRRPWASQRPIVRSASRRTLAHHPRKAAVAG